MKELMLELLTYEPFGEFLPEEKEYIHEILSGNDNPPSSLAFITIISRISRMDRMGIPRI